MTNFPYGTHILFAAVPPNAPLRQPTAFVPVDDLDHAGHQWERFRRIKGPQYRPPGVDTHLAFEFADSSTEPRTYNLSHETPVAIVLSNVGGQVTFTSGTILMRAALSVRDLIRLGTGVFLPVVQAEYLGHTWEKYSLATVFHDASDGFTAEFEDPAIGSRPYPTNEPIPLFSAGWETGEVLAKLLGG